MPLTALLIDDEANSRNTIRNLLSSLCPDVEILGEAKNADAGIEMIRALKPKLIFLDIQMPGKTGFDLLASIGEIDFEVIFTTAYHEYAVKAFRFSAIDYLLKPIDPDDLLQAVNRVKEKQHQTSTGQVQLLKQLWQQLGGNQPATGTGTAQRLALSTQEGIHLIDLKDIVWCESLGAYTRFYLSNGDKLVASRLIKEYEEILTDYQFFRVHQSYIINLNHVKKYVKGDGGQVWMSDGAEVEVARRRKEEFLEVLSNFYVNNK
jgi:two-component system LytT family response regulator